jgi:hypothetical protein
MVKLKRRMAIAFMVVMIETMLTAHWPCVQLNR